MTSKISAPVTIPATTAHRQFGDLIKRAFSGKEHFIVEKDGLPVVAIIPMAEYEELMQEREQRKKRLQQFQTAARALGEGMEQHNLSEEEMLKQLEQTRGKLYQEKYGRKSTR